MKDFFRHNGILILIAAILLALVTAVVSMLFGGVADPLSNLVGIDRMCGKTGSYSLEIVVI